MFSTLSQFQESRPSGVQGYIRDDALVHPKKARAQSEVTIRTQGLFKGDRVTSSQLLSGEKWETTKVTTNGHTVCITYFARTHQVVARVLHHNQRSTEISSAYLPTELKRIRNAEQFNFLLNHCYLRTATFSNGEIVLHLNGKLAGGSGYKTALDQLKSHLQDLANPYFHQYILKKLTEISTSVLDTESGIVSFFANLSIPEDTRVILTSLSREITTYGRARVDDLQEAIVQIKKDLQQLVTDGKREDLLWPELECLLNLPQIRQQPNEEIKRILRYIKLSRTEDLKDYIVTLIEPDKIAECDSALESTPYENMMTLLNQVVKEMPRKKEGIATYWDQTPAFFVDRSLIVVDPTHIHSISGTILKAEKDQQNRWVFQLHDETEVVITPEYQVTIKRKTKYKLWTAINNQIILPGQTFRLTLPPDRKTTQGMMIPGDYQVQSATDITSLIQPNYTQIVLTGESSGIKRYTLRAYHATDPSQISKISIYRAKEGKDEKLGDLNPPAFNGLYMACITTENEIRGIPPHQADDHIRIKDERDENKIKLQHLKMINEMLNEIRAALLSKENRSLLDLLIDELVKQKLTKVDLELLRAHQPELTERIDHVSQRYATNLQLKQTAEEILRKLVEEANYACLIDKEQSVIVAKTMQLLRQSHEEIKTILNKTIIAFFGDTGSGKSTAVNYFKGVKLEYFTNRVGDRVIQIKKEVADQSALPKIGQALGESETLYPKGYPVTVKDKNIREDKGEELVLADFPGFEDTRGEDYELCTQLSIDLAVQNANRIRSIVITIPIHAFLTERANHVIRLVEKVREKFPFAFDSDLPLDNASIFVLITKATQVRQETANGIKDRIDALFRESQEKIAKVMAAIEGGKEESNFDLRSIQRRSRIWQALQQMYDRGQIDLITIDDSIERNKWLGKFRSAPGINKKAYIQAMQSYELKMKFGKYVEMSTDTWTRHIFEQYLREFPDSIQKVKEKITEKRENIKACEEEENRRLTDIVELWAAETTYLGLIKQLENAQRDSKNQLSTELHAKLELLILQSHDEAILRLQGNLKQTNKRIAATKERIEILNGKFNELFEIRTTKTSKKTLFEADVMRLSRGRHSEILWRKSWESHSLIRTGDIDPQDRQIAFNEIRRMDEIDSENPKTTVARDYRGVLLHDALISREYKLVPADPVLRRQFQNAFLTSNSVTLGNYQAEVSGERFTIDLGMKADPGGKKIIYGFQTEWKGDVIPRIEITYTIPNVDYNEATIIDKNAEIAVLNRQIRELAFELTEMKDEKRRAEGRLSTLEEEKSKIECEIEAQKKVIAQEKLEEMLKSQKEGLEKIRNKIKELQDFTRIESEIEQLEQELKALDEKLLKLHKTKRNLAVVIHQEKGTAKVIRDFSQIVVDQARTSTEERPELVNACRKFMDSYDQNIGKVEEECKKDLPFTN